MTAPFTMVDFHIPNYVAPGFRTRFLGVGGESFDKQAYLDSSDQASTLRSGEFGDMLAPEKKSPAIFPFRVGAQIQSTDHWHIRWSSGDAKSVGTYTTGYK